MKIILYIKTVFFLFWIGFKPSLCQSVGPGVPSITFPQQEIFTSIASVSFDVQKLNSTETLHLGNNLTAMHKGYLFIISGEEGDPWGGGFQFYDINDPYNPSLVHSEYSNETQDFLETHGFGFSSSYNGDYVVFESKMGLQFWDLTDVKSPKLLSKLNLLPDTFIPSSYGRIWSVFWQAPYVYAAGFDNGTYIVDASDPANPKLVKWLSGQELGTGPSYVYAVGNLLFASHAQHGGHILVDISNPADPQMISRVYADGHYHTEKGYSAIINGNKIFIGGSASQHSYIWDVSDPVNPAFEDSIYTGGFGGDYFFVQDQFLMIGSDEDYIKYDLSTKTEINRAKPGGQPGHPVPFGNFLVIGDDHSGASFVPHATEPDTKGPTVNMVNPRDRDSLQALTSRVGLTFTDHIDLQSVNNQSFIVREFGGTAITGKYSGQQQILNFWPDSPLKPGTLYEVLVPKGGLKDWSGNATENDFVSYFTTAGNAPSFSVAIPGDSMTATATSEATGQMADNVLDGDVSSLWEGESNYPQEIILQLYQPFDIIGLQYTPRQIGDGGNITQYEIHVSPDGIIFNLISSGNWADNRNVKRVNFSLVNATHVKLVAVHGTGGSAVAAEIEIFRNNPLIPTSVRKKLFSSRILGFQGKIYDLQGRRLDKSLTKNLADGLYFYRDENESREIMLKIKP